MEIVTAEHLGFCYGVKRAINMAREQGKEKGCVYTLGPIIHNPQMVALLEREGVHPINDLSQVDSGTVIIRSHGVGPHIYEQAAQRNLQIVDATCPHVKKAQLSAQKLAEDGYTVVIIGEKMHPEVKSIHEWAGPKTLSVETVEETKKVPEVARLGIVAQTTFSHIKFNQIVGELLNKSHDIKILRTICTATDQRQAAAEALARRVDMMLVIGGKNSANTTRLACLCAECCQTHHIETADELQVEWFTNIEKIGVTAGASTPDWLIKEVYEKCRKMNRT